ncbi:hypothetical protein CRM22_002843, partial [Opisthorchis felineus]
AHKKLRDFDEREAQLQYIQLCRSLPTYGITFFLIKEKLKGRNKLVPRLFGVSKESVMRVDENTKDILETWPLTRIRRWAAGPNLFTLFQVIDLDQPKRALRSRVDLSLRTIKEAAEELDTPIYADDDAIRGDDA